MLLNYHKFRTATHQITIKDTAEEVWKVDMHFVTECKYILFYIVSEYKGILAMLVTLDE